MNETMRKAIVTAAVMLATVMQTLDSTIANVALPHMQGSVAATQDQIAWVLTSYIIAAAISTPLTAFLAIRFGRKRLLTISVIGFTLTSMLCGAAQTLDQIVLFRLAQGMFGAAFVPLSQTIMFDMYTIEQRGKMMALWGVGVMVGPIVGPALGGWLTENYSWRWVFYINVPFGALAFAGLGALRESTLSRERRFDWLGFTFLSLGIGAMQLMLDRGNSEDWFGSSEIILESLIAAFGFYLFIAHSATTKQPFIDLELFKDRNLVIGLCLTVAVGFVLYATMALMPSFLQSLKGYPVVTTGIVLAPRGFGTMIAMVIAGRIINSVDMRLIIASGFALTSFTLWEMGHFDLNVSEAAIIRTGVMQGLGLGFIFAPLTTISFVTLAAHLRPEGTSFYSLIRNVGSSIGIASTQAMIATMTQVNHAQLATHVSDLNPLLRSGVAPAAYSLKSSIGLGVLNGEVTRQAAAIAYIDSFKLMMWFTLIAVPSVYLMRSPKMTSAPDPELAHAVMD